ncbi:MAG: hypothetical protein KJZ84_09165 [Bryobacteraceae bacterium]|nr:hypothetical protein [Bryobacteraceae bacterium]
MLAAFLLLANLSGCVPARWSTNDPASVALLKETPINCVLLEAPAWSAAFSKAARAAGIAPLGVVREGADAAQTIEQARSAGLEGLVLEGDFEDAALGAYAGQLPLAVLTSRSKLRLEGAAAGVTGTYQGAWPGIRAVEDDTVQAGPTGAPWINTNGGFLRFVRAASNAEVWIGYHPPENEPLRVERYVMAVADAAVAGARWVVALDVDFTRRLLARESRALTDWRTLGAALDFFERNRAWTRLPPAGTLAVVQDTASGALISGGLLDMIGARHTPARPIPTRLLKAEQLAGTRVVVDIEPASVPATGRALLKEFESAGNTVIAPPADFRFPAMPGFQLSLDKLEKRDHDQLDAVWQRVTRAIGRRNLGARVFNAPGVLSHLAGEPDSNRRVLFLVNYTDYQAESITVWLPGRFSKARLHLPDGQVKELEPYRVEEGWGVDIEVMRTLAILETE